MLHYTCDLCGQHMSATDDRRYVVKMEVYAVHDPAELTEADLDDDHLDEVSQLLEDMEAGLRFHRQLIESHRSDSKGESSPENDGEQK